MPQHIQHLFSDINISQGSVATPLRCGGICDDTFIANFLLCATVKEFSKSINIRRSYVQEFGVLFFLTHGVCVQMSQEVMNGL